MGRCTQVFDTYLENFVDPEVQRYIDKIAFALGIYQPSKDEASPYRSSKEVVEEGFTNFTSKN